MKPALDSRELFRKLGDKEGEAGALLTIVNLQMANQLPTEALKSAKEAELLSRGLNDAAGQAAALQAAANVYVMQMRHQEAVRVATEAQAVLQKAGDARGEAAAWQVVCQVHLNLCIRAADQGRNADPRTTREGSAEGRGGVGQAAAG